MNKLCRICGKLLDIEKNFHKKKGTPDGYRNECKECVKILLKKYKEGDENKAKRKAYDKKRYEENRDEILEQKKEYHIKNRDSILEKKNEYRKNHRAEAREYIKKYRKENPEKFYKYRRDNPHIIAWRTIVYSTLKRLVTEKQGHTIDELGYSAEDLKVHIEKQFTVGMSWNNHGEWHIDHIKPVTAFDKDTDVRIVCALENLRPMWATTREIDGVIYEGNINKSNK